jgi:hypothetical protein
MQSVYRHASVQKIKAYAQLRKSFDSLRLNHQAGAKSSRGRGLPKYLDIMAKPGKFSGRRQPGGSCAYDVDTNAVRSGCHRFCAPIGLWLLLTSSIKWLPYSGFDKKTGVATPE